MPPDHVITTYIKAPPEAVWRALTESDFTTRYYYRSTVESDWQAGSPYRYAIDGETAIEGEILEADPPRRLVMTFSAVWDPALAADAPTRLSWELDVAGPGLTRLTVVHGGFEGETETYRQVTGGWSWILAGLKSLLETGRGAAAPRLSGACTRLPPAPAHRDRRGVPRPRAVTPDGTLGVPRVGWSVARVEPRAIPNGRRALPYSAGSASGTRGRVGASGTGAGSSAASPAAARRAPRRRYDSATTIVIVMNTSDAVLEMIIAQFVIDRPYASQTIKPPASIER